MDAQSDKIEIWWAALNPAERERVKDWHRTSQLDARTADSLRRAGVLVVASHFVSNDSGPSFLMPTEIARLVSPDDVQDLRPDASEDDAP